MSRAPTLGRVSCSAKLHSPAGRFASITSFALFSLQHIDRVQISQSISHIIPYQLSPHTRHYQHNEPNQRTDVLRLHDLDGHKFHVLVHI